MEEEDKDSLVQFFAAKKIGYVDVTQAMESQTEQHQQIYPKDSDGHPLATGYGVIARTIQDALRSQQHGK